MAIFAPESSYRRAELTLVVVAVMICLGRRRSGVMQFDRLTVRRVEISLAPGFLPLADFGGRCRALKPDYCLERDQPLPVVSGVGRLVGPLRMGFYLGAEYVHPFVPGEQSPAAYSTFRRI